MSEETTLDHIVLQETYILGFRREGSDVLISAELLLDDGRAVQGCIVFPHVSSDVWEDAKGQRITLEELNSSAHSYFGGIDEPADMGTINSVRVESGWWLMQGDWGKCRLRSDAAPRVVLDRIIS